jgi:hypothetical protein
MARSVTLSACSDVEVVGPWGYAENISLCYSTFYQGHLVDLGDFGKWPHLTGSNRLLHELDAGTCSSSDGEMQVLLA